jgi:hypothetical protein
MSSVESILRSLGGDERRDDTVQTPDFHAGEYRARAAEALNLWLRWNAVYENVTTAMFERRLNQQQLQESMDLADQLRQKAVQLTQELVGPVKS